MKYTFRNVFVWREYVLMLMTSTTEKISHSELIVKYNICLKLFCNKAYQNLYFMVFKFINLKLLLESQVSVINLKRYLEMCPLYTNAPAIAK